MFYKVAFSFNEDVSLEQCSMKLVLTKLISDHVN